MQEKLVIMLHGVGSNGLDLLPIAQYWQRQVEGLTIATPNAPFPFMQSHEVFEWFSLTGITVENRFERVAKAREYFDRTVRNIVLETEFNGHIDQIIFCGFSQGTIMALDAVVSGRWPVAGVIGYSGRLVSPIDSKASTQTPISLMHGNDDEIIAVSEAQSAYQVLQDAGFKVDLETYDHLGHSVNELEVIKGLQFIQSL